MVKEALEAMPDCVRVGGHHVQAVQCTDDRAMTTRTDKALQRMLTVLNNTVEQYGK